MQNDIKSHRILNPRLDPIFKILFTQETKESNNALTSLLSACLGRKVSDIVLLPNEITTLEADQKQCRFDLTCKVDGKEPVNIEMQGQNYYGTYDNRCEYYVAHLMEHFVEKGSDSRWIEVPTVYQINLINFIYDESNPNGISHYSMRRSDGKALKSQKLNLYFVELPKYRGKDDRIEEIPNLTAIEKWSKFFVYADNEKMQDYVEALCKTEEGIMDAKVTLGTISQDDVIWKQQTDYFMLQTDKNTMIYEAEQRGEAKGKLQNALDTAKNLLSLGVDKGIIVKATGLTDEQVSQLDK